MSKTVHLIVVGRLKDKHLEAIEENYLQRINSPDLKVHEVKARAESKNQEALEVLKKINDLTKDSPANIIALTEFGKEYDSVEFSKKVFDLIEKNQKLIFIVAGAEGFSSELLAMASHKISLSKMTFPHKIARILFIEQFYRAITIKNNHPYHN